MQIDNPLQMNDWEIKRFIRIILAMQLALWGLIGLDAIGIKVPIARQLIGFIYLTFVPGFILLRILKLHSLGNIESILYAVGLSISTTMFTGAFMNAILPPLGISRPISMIPLIVTISVIILILNAICYVIDKDFQSQNYIDIKIFLSPSVLILCMIPFLAIFGAYAANFFHTNSILFIMLILIAVIAALIGLDLFISSKMFPFAVFLIAVSLVFHKSLISMYIWGWDINLELYLANLVIMHSIWDPSIPFTCNSMLSLVMLAPIYSLISDLNTIWVFKIIYPFLFSLVPLGLYRVFQKQTNDSIAFVSCLFFISFNVYYIEMLQLARQQIAELFLTLSILVIINKELNTSIRSSLLIIFSISLTVSHYGLSYIFMLCLILVWITLIIAENPYMQKIIKIDINRIKSENRLIKFPYVLLFISFTLTWYMYSSNSSAFNSIVIIGKHIICSISTDFLDPDSAQGLHLAMAQANPSFLHVINKFIIYLNQIFIIIGGVVLFVRFNMSKFELEYVSFAELNVMLCFAGVLVPFFASSINMTRLYHITLIFLAPICIIGGITVIWGIIRLVGMPWTSRHLATSVKVLSIYFAVFLLYQSGVVYELTEGVSSPLMVYNSSIDYPRFNDQEVSGAMWLNNERGNNSMYADNYRLLLLGSLERYSLRQYPVNSSYIYLGTFNIINGTVNSYSKTKAIRYYFYDGYQEIIDDRSKIFANGGVEVYNRRS